MFLIQCGISNLHQHPFGIPKMVSPCWSQNSLKMPSRLQKLGDEGPHDQRTAEGISGLSFFLSKKVKAWKVCAPNFTKQSIVQVSPAPNDWNPLKSQSDPVELRCLIHEALSVLVSEHGKNHRSEGDYHHGAKPLIPIDMAMITMVLLVNTKTLPGCDGWPAASCSHAPGGCSWGN